MWGFHCNPTTAPTSRGIGGVLSPIRVWGQAQCCLWLILPSARLHCPYQKRCPFSPGMSHGLCGRATLRSAPPDKIAWKDCSWARRMPSRERAARKEAHTGRSKEVRRTGPKQTELCRSCLLSILSGWFMLRGLNVLSWINIYETSSSCVTVMTAPPDSRSWTPSDFT